MCHANSPGTTGLALDREVIALPDGLNMPARVARPNASANAPAVVVVDDMFGPSTFYADLCSRLAGEGFTAIEPDYFHRSDALPEPSIEQARARRGGLDARQVVVDLAAAVQWARTRCGAPSVGVIGFCIGGSYAMALAATCPRVAAVSYYGFPPGAFGDRSVPDLEGPAADPPGKVLGHFGADDNLVSAEDVVAAGCALQRLGVPHEFVVHPGAGHGFMRALTTDQPTHERTVARESWQRTLAFLRSATN